MSSATSSPVKAPRPTGRGGNAGHNRNRNTTAPRVSFTDAEKEQARGALDVAFGLAGLGAGGKPICPICHRSDKLSANLARGSYCCHRCRGRKGVDTKGKDLAQGDAIDLLTRFAGYSFVDAVCALLGRPTSSKRAPVKPVEVVVSSEPDFVAELDPELYAAILAAGSVKLAEAFYARFHIDPAVVAESGAVIVRNPAATVADLTARFGAERLVAAGLVKETKYGPFALLNRDYPVVEPHFAPDGSVRALQFRASIPHEAKIAAFKAYSKAAEAAEAAGVACDVKPVKYVPKFLSLRGATAGLVGCGLRRLAEIEPADVFIVEGFKDLLAARTMGAEAYAIPGVGVAPPAEALEVLRRHRVVLSLDGDEAGAEGSVRIGQVLTDAGVTWRERKTPLPDGMDVTDVLVDRHARAGHGCAVCKAWRESHPAG